MRKVLLALTATFAVCLAVFAGTNMCVKKQNGDILRINVDDVYEVYFEDIFNPDTSAIVPPFIEPSIADSADFYPLEFEVLTNNTVAVSGYDHHYFYDEAGNYIEKGIEIPSKVRINEKIYDVTSIGYNAFGKCDHLTSITIPESVTEIGSFAFYNCHSLTSITIPESVTSIGSDAFFWCSSLTSITIPESVTSIGFGAFDNCKELDIVIENSEENVKVGSRAFEGVKSVTWKKDLDSSSVADTSAYAPLKFEITSDSTVKLAYGDYYSYDNLDSVNIPAKVKIDGKVYSVTSIGSDAFAGGGRLTSIEIPSSVTSIGERAFAGCGSLTSIEIPSSVTSIGEGAFMECSSLTSIAIPSSVTSIGEYTFDGCSRLTSVEIPSSVTSIGEYAFDGCSRLTSVEIPSSVTSIGDWAFYGCSNLESINVDAKNPNYSSLDGIFYNKEKTEIIAVPNGIKGSISIPESVTSIGSSAFYGCSSLTSVEIPSSVTSIGSSAFSNCSSLTSIEIPTSVTSIGSVAFYGCSSLTSIEIPSSVTSIGSSAFSGCSSLESINVDAKNPNYSSLNGIVYNKEKTEIIAVPKGIKGSISIPSSVTSISYSAFSLCRSLTSVEIPSSVTEIGSDAFYNCKDLDVVIDNSEENVKVEGDSFYGVKSVKWLKKVADVSVYAPLRFEITSDSTVELTRGENWNSYRNLDSVNIPAKVKIEGKVYSVTSIGSSAFRVCSSLTSITIPESVTEIGESAFFSCSSLTSITIPESVTEIGEYAFGYCSSVTSIEIPSSVTSIGRGAFSGYDKLDPEVLIYDYGTKCFGCIGDSSKCVEVVIPEGVISIDNSAFEGYYNLTSITIPESVTSIGSYAFSGCSSLESINVDVKNSIYSSLDGIIYNKEKTEIIYVPRGIKGSIHIPEGVTEIGEYAFYYCSSLESINVDAKNPNYSSLDGIVYNKEKTEIIAVPKGIKGSISIPSSVTSISYSAFYDCDSLTSIEIPSSVTSIGERAFAGCGSLTSIEIPSSVTSIGEYAFCNCENLDVVIDNSEENVKVGYRAFGDVKSVNWLK